MVMMKMVRSVCQFDLVSEDTQLRGLHAFMSLHTTRWQIVVGGPADLQTQSYLTPNRGLHPPHGQIHEYSIQRPYTLQNKLESDAYAG